MKWQFWLISFIPLHALLFWLSKWWIHVTSWITSCEINFCWVMSILFEKCFRNLCRVLVLAFSSPIWQTLCSYAEMRKIFIAQKSQCACCALSLATIRCKYYFNLFWTELGQVENFLIAPCMKLYTVDKTQEICEGGSVSTSPCLPIFYEEHINWCFCVCDSDWHGVFAIRVSSVARMTEEILWNWRWSILLSTCSTMTTTVRSTCLTAILVRCGVMCFRGS